MTTDLAIDPPGLHSPQHFLGGAEWEAVYLQLTHRGVPVWICENMHCEKFTGADTEPEACPACGDSTTTVFHPESYPDPETVEAKFGPSSPRSDVR